MDEIEPGCLALIVPSPHYPFGGAHGEWNGRQVHVRSLYLFNEGKCKCPVFQVTAPFLDTQNEDFWVAPKCRLMRIDGRDILEATDIKEKVETK